MANLSILIANTAFELKAMKTGQDSSGHVWTQGKLYLNESYIADFSDDGYSCGDKFTYKSKAAETAVQLYLDAHPHIEQAIMDDYNSQLPAHLSESETDRRYALEQLANVLANNLEYSKLINRNKKKGVLYCTQEEYGESFNTAKWNYNVEQLMSVPNGIKAIQAKINELTAADMVIVNKAYLESFGTVSI